MPEARFIKDVPQEPHYAALVESSYTGPDGYGDTSTAHMIDYVVIGNDEKLKAWILESDTPLYGRAPKVYTIIHVRRVAVTKHVEITLA